MAEPSVVDSICTFPEPEYPFRLFRSLRQLGKSLAGKFFFFMCTVVRYKSARRMLALTGTRVSATSQNSQDYEEASGETYFKFLSAASIAGIRWVFIRDFQT